jgi:hypothetical protein
MATIMIVFLMMVWLLMNLATVHEDKPMPDTRGCGISIEDNSSMRRTVTTHGFILVGKILMPTTTTNTYRYYDLICKNGTVIPGWSS